MAAKVTRRGLAALAATPLMPSSPAQTQARLAEDDLTVQRDRLRRWREQNKQVNITRAVEPAFVFRP